jgi:hypothetical protein
VEKQTEIKKRNTGKIGFMLTIAAPLSVLLPLIILFIIPFPMIGLVLFIIPPVLFLLSVVYCTHGLIKKRNRKLATTGLLIDALIIVILFFLLIGLTPPGTMPYPLNIYKFKKTCPKAAFWLDFDKEHIEQVQSQSLFIFGSIGTVHFISSSYTYTTQQVIQYAEANKWKYHASIPASRLQEFLNANENDLSIEELIFRSDIISMNPLTFLMEQDDSVLIFETENYLGIPSLAILSRNKDKLRVYYNNQARPDPASDFSLPESFYELNENKNEEIHEN